MAWKLGVCVWEHAWLSDCIEVVTGPVAGDVKCAPGANQRRLS